MVNWLSELVARGDFEVSPDILKNVLNYSLLSMEIARNELDKEGAMQNYDFETFRSLIDPKIIFAICKKIEKQGITLDEDMQKKVDSYEQYHYEHYLKYSTKISEERNIIIEKLKAGASIQELMEVSPSMAGIKYATSIYILEDNPSPEVIKTLFNCAFLNMERVKAQMSENDSTKKMENEYTTLAFPSALLKLKDKLEEIDRPIDPDLQQKINEYIEFYEFFKLRRDTERHKLETIGRMSYRN